MAWLLLITEVPSDPVYLRVKLRRRVARLGALSLKGAVFLLPDSGSSVDSFHQLRTEIVGEGGDATLARMTLVEGLSDNAIKAKFREERDAEYTTFVADAVGLQTRWRTSAGAGRGALLSERDRLLSRMEAIVGRDFFQAPRQEAAMKAMEQLAVLEILPVVSPAGPATAWL